MSESNPLPVLLVCGCQKYLPYLHAGIRRYSRPTHWRTIGFLGEPTASTATFDEVSSVLTLPVADTYEDLPQKIRAAIAWVQSQWPSTPGIFKTDDDIVIPDLDCLNAAIQSHIAARTPYAGLYVSTCRDGTAASHRIETRFTDKQRAGTYKGAHYCYGAGYWLSTEAMQVAVAAEQEYGSACLEDVCTGYVMNCAGIKPVKINVRYKERVRDDALLTSFA